MDVAIPIFDGLTALDAVGPYDVLSRVPGAEVAFAALEPGPKRTENGMLALVADRALDELTEPEVVVVPGGFGTRALVNDPRAIAYLKSWGDRRPIASVCTGALLLGRAGFLAGRRATTHHGAYEELRPYCREVVTDRRVVDEGAVITAGGVASSLDLGLYLVEKFWGAAAREKIAAQMAYRAYSAA
jgi:transcriptional regulator GlxA family with amidase domain